MAQVVTESAYRRPPHRWHAQAKTIFGLKPGFRKRVGDFAYADIQLQFCP
jgi:hypothetical protein